MSVSLELWTVQKMIYNNDLRKSHFIAVILEKET